jgi:hypothetical protein
MAKEGSPIILSQTFIASFCLNCVSAKECGFPSAHGRWLHVFKIPLRVKHASLSSNNVQLGKVVGAASLSSSHLQNALDVHNPTVVTDLEYVYTTAGHATPLLQIVGKCDDGPTALVPEDRSTAHRKSTTSAFLHLHSLPVFVILGYKAHA